MFYNDLWEYDGTQGAWTQLIAQADPTSPPGRSAHALVYDSDTNRVLVFGGTITGFVRRNDLWSWNGGLNDWYCIR